MAQCEIWFKQDLQEPIVVQQIKGNVFHNDNNSVKLGVELTDGGTAATLSGYAVAGYLIREDGTTMVQTGTISSNKASIIIPNNALVVVGRLDIVLKLTKDSDRISVLACTGYVHRTTTDTIVVPERLVPTLDELLAEVESFETSLASLKYQTMSSTDLNTYTGSSDHVEFYTASSIKNFTNIPAVLSSNAWPFVLEVIKIGGYTKQILHLYVSEGMNNKGIQFVRQQTYSSGTVWGNWVLLEDVNQHIAIVAPGLTAPKAITKGQYIVYNGGLCKAKAPISSGETLTTSNLDSVTDGGLNAVDNKEKVNILNQQSANTTTTFASLGVSFTLPRKAIVQIVMAFSSGRPYAVGCKLNEEDSGATHLFTCRDSTITTASTLIASGFLDAGTWYVWGKTETAGNTLITVNAIYI